LPPDVLLLALQERDGFPAATALHVAAGDPPLRLR
jgi:hypothetical protein